jgi:pimeloyl-ACP methyl ester carboxylesterase
MKTRSVSFESSHLRLDGDLHLPEREAGERLPGVVVCSGYQGLKTIHPARFARALVPAGFACLGFDYRGFGQSEGPPGRLFPQEQVEDTIAAVGFLTSVDEVDPARIGLVGWGLGGGIVIAAAAAEPRVRAVVSLNGIGDGRRATQAAHDNESWVRLLARIEADRAGSESELVPPFDVLPLDRVTGEYAHDELERYAGFGSEVTLESAAALIDFRPERLVSRISPRPLLLVHGSDNRLNPPDESVELHRLAGEPKELVLLPGAGHTEWMYDDNPIFRQVAGLTRAFLERSLRAGPAAEPAAADAQSLAE